MTVIFRGPKEWKLMRARARRYGVLALAAWIVPWDTGGTLRGEKGAISGSNRKQRQRVTYCFYSRIHCPFIASDGATLPF